VLSPRRVGVLPEPLHEPVPVQDDVGMRAEDREPLAVQRAEPGPLSHLERPNYDFATYLAQCVAPGVGPGGR